jgi:hypothetical protein
MLTEAAESGDQALPSMLLALKELWRTLQQLPSNKETTKVFQPETCKNCGRRRSVEDLIASLLVGH